LRRRDAKQKLRERGIGKKSIADASAQSLSDVRRCQ
jgi:hypothetical protein